MAKKFRSIRIIHFLHLGEHVPEAKLSDLAGSWKGEVPDLSVGERVEPLQCTAARGIKFCNGHISMAAESLRVGIAVIDYLNQSAFCIAKV